MRKLAAVVALATVSAFLVTTAAGNSILAKVARWLVVETPPHPVDLIVALGGDRLRQEKAVALYEKHLGRYVLFTGADARDRDYGCLGLPPQAVLPVTASVFTTNGEGSVVKEAVLRNRFRSVMIITSSYHSRRALAVFRKEFRGTGVEILSTVCGEPAFLHQPWWKSHMGIKTIAGEYAGLAYYWVHGWI